MNLRYLTLPCALMALFINHCAHAPMERNSPSRPEAYQIDLSVDSDAKWIAEGSALRFPSPARSAGKSGYVEVSIWVDTTGRVREVNILKESPMGYGFADAARDHAFQLRFRPAVSNGKYVSQWFHRKYEFKLNDFHITRPQD